MSAPDMSQEDIHRVRREMEESLRQQKVRAEAITNNPPPDNPPPEEEEAEAE